MCFTEVVVEGELVIVPNLDGQSRSQFGLSFINTPEMFLRTHGETRGIQREAREVLSVHDFYTHYKLIFMYGKHFCSAHLKTKDKTSEDPKNRPKIHLNRTYRHLGCHDIRHMDYRDQKNSQQLYYQ